MNMMSDAYDLALALVAPNADPVDHFEYGDKIDVLLAEKYGISSDNFEALVKDLLPLCMVGKSPLPETVYRGFANDECWLMKLSVKVKNEHQS